METKTNPMNVYKYLRTVKGMTLKAVADATGISAVTICLLEQGRNPNLGTAERLAAYYGVSINCLARNNISEAAQTVSTALSWNHTKEYFRDKQTLCSEIGDRGEQIVLAKEKKRLAGTPYASAVTGRVSDDMGAGYDILSFDAEGRPRYLEVKATGYGENTAFYMSRNELRFAQECAEKGRAYELHRIYNLKEDGTYKEKVLAAKELLQSYEMIPNSFIVRRAQK